MFERMWKYRAVTLGVQAMCHGICAKKVFSLSPLGRTCRTSQIECALINEVVSLEGRGCTWGWVLSTTCLQAVEEHLQAVEEHGL